MMTGGQDSLLTHSQLARQNCTCAISFWLYHRLWQWRFQQQDPVWAATGVAPGTGKHLCQTWRQLYAQMSQLRHVTEHESLSSETTLRKLEQLWDSGEEA